jgi:uncharacterized protein YneF (UPF0154 family)
MFSFSDALNIIIFFVLLIVFIVGGIIFLILKHRQDEEKNIPPLDIVDAKKLDDMVVRQVEGTLQPILMSKGYAEEQIQEILTRTSTRAKTFRR